jgi:hypothetical protein
MLLRALIFKRFQVSGVRCQPSRWLRSDRFDRGISSEPRALNPRMKLHRLLQKCSFFFRFDWALAARGGARMKLHIVGTDNRLNVEHRTSNIERPILKALRFIYFTTSEPQNIECRRVESLFSVFFKIDRIHYSMLGVRCSMFIFS